MSSVDKGLFLLPTRRRLDKLAKFFASYRATGATARGVLIVDGKEYSELCVQYDALLPPGWDVWTTSKDGGAAYKCQTWLEQTTYVYDWIGFLSDDYEAKTFEWDKALAAQITGWNVVSSNDEWQAPKRMIGAILWSTDYLHAVGFLAIPGTQHHYWDDVHEIIGKATGCWTVDMDVVVSHRHASLEIKPVDSTTSRLADLIKDDARLFDKWRIEERDKAIERVLKLMGEKGVPIETIDLKGIRLMISTPCSSGKYHRTYVKSLLQTVLALRQYGAHVDWFDHPNSSDLLLARSNLFAAFYRSSFTHWLAIDDDMGWNFMDVVRMIKLDREFIAAAGPSKSEEPRFAVSNQDDFGRALPTQVEGSTRVMHATHVGGAFVMINRSCAEKMVAAYGDLEFLDAQKQSCWGLYHSYIINRRHVGEDFAFSERWRKLGGRIDVLTTVRLQHSGDKTWDGVLFEWMQDKFQEAQARENENAASSEG